MDLLTAMGWISAIPVAVAVTASFATSLLVASALTATWARPRTLLRTPPNAGWLPGHFRLMALTVTTQAAFHHALVIDDLAPTREWLTGLVHSAFDNVGVYHADDLRSARAWFAERPDAGATTLALVDLGLPDGSGIDLIREVGTSNPAVQLVVTTIYADDDHLLRAIAAGAHSYLLKDRPAAETIAMLRRIGSGEAALSPPMARRMLEHFRAHASFMTAGTATLVEDGLLTPRETEVLAMIGRGLTLSETGHALAISSQTVASHVKAIYRKLGINSRAEAAMEAIRRKLT